MLAPSYIIRFIFTDRQAESALGLGISYLAYIKVRAKMSFKAFKIVKKELSLRRIK